MNDEVRDVKEDPMEAPSGSTLSSSPIPHPFINRWKHRLNLHFRVWPKWKLTHQALATMKIIDIDGIRINDDGRPELWHKTANGECGYVFEISDEDFDVITAIPKAGARMPILCFVPVAAAAFPSTFLQETSPTHSISAQMQVKIFFMIGSFLLLWFF